MFTLYRRTDEIEIFEDTPQVAMVMRPTETAVYQVYDGKSNNWQSKPDFLHDLFPGYNHASLLTTSLLKLYIFLLAIRALS